MGQSMIDFEGRAWGPKEGLEGPLHYPGRRVLYWSPTEGQYYDPITDMYISTDEHERIYSKP